MRHLGTTRTRLEGGPFSWKVPIAQCGKSRRRGRLTLIVGVNVAPPAFCHQACWGAKEPQGNPFSRAHVTVPASTMAPPACVTAAGGADPCVSVALATARTQLAAIRVSELGLVRYVLHVLRDENLQLPACSPLVGDGSGSRCSCGVSFSAPAVSWGPPPIAGSLQRRCSSATRCGRARLAAGAAEIVSTPRLVGDQGPVSVVSTPARGRFS